MGSVVVKPEGIEVTCDSGRVFHVRGYDKNGNYLDPTTCKPECPELVRFLQGIAAKYNKAEK